MLPLEEFSKLKSVIPATICISGNRVSWPTTSYCIEGLRISPQYLFSLKLFHSQWEMCLTSPASTPDTISRGQSYRKYCGWTPIRVHSYATSISLPDSMKASARCVELGSPHNPIQIHSPVPLQPSLPRRVHPTVTSTSGRDVTPPRWRDRGGSSFRLKPQLFQSVLPCSKEGHALSKFFPLQRNIQDADIKNYPGADPNRGLVCYHIFYCI